MPCADFLHKALLFIDVTNTNLNSNAVKVIMKRYLIVLLCLISYSFIFAQESCYDCHGDVDFVGVTDNGEERSLYVDAEKYQNSVRSSWHPQPG